MQQGITKFSDVVSDRQKTEILSLFEKHGEMCFSILVKKGKDENKNFINNTTSIKLIDDLLSSGFLVETKIGVCPYTGKNSVFWNTKEKSLEKIEKLNQSFKNVLDYMSQREIFSLSQRDLKSLIS